MMLENLSDKAFRQFSDLVYAECGICLTDEKRELLKARLAKRLRCLKLPTNEYFDLILTDMAERSRFIDAISTNHTFFFRESGCFEYIAPSCREIWCAASSSGEEPYSVAAHCLHRGFGPKILATDISDTCLEKGRQGIYPLEVKTSIPADLLKKYFQKGKGHWQGYLRAKPELRNMIHFQKLNLLSDTIPAKLFDVILCRNVMIYFDSPTKEKVVNKLTAALKPRGYLLIGGAESLNGLKHPLKYLKPSVYMKSD